MRIEKLKNYFIQWKMNKKFVFIFLKIDIFLYILFILFLLKNLLLIINK